MGAVTVGISCTPDSQLARAVDLPIGPLPGPEIIAGSTRLRAGTATKLVLNMLSTAAMIRLGCVYGNRMVNVRPTNAKLRDRAIRIVSEAGKVDLGRAEELLDEAGGSVRTAIVMARRNIARAQAELLLEAAGGRISAALGEQ
jgi:N-acetylmuramic acid 6-phosphate etherase